MDQLTACQILEIEPDSSREEIMEAYARMVKRYHPEDNPTEFAQIQEAYRVLMKGKRRKHRQEQKTAAEYTAGTGTYMDEHEAAGAYTDQHVNAGTDADEHVDAGAYTDEHMNAGTDADEHEDAGAYTDKHEAAGTDADEYEAAAALFEKRFQEFDYRDELRMEEERRYREEEIARREAAFLEKQREEEEQERREREQIQWAAEYLENILRDSSMSGKPQVYSQYFLNPQVQEIMDSRRYIRLLLKLLEKYPQKSKIYRLIRNIYKSREDDILKDRLMLFLDEKLGVDSAEAQKFPWHCGFIVAAEVFELVKNIRADNVLLLFFVFLVFDMIIAEYYYMRRSYSFRISQIFASLTALFCLTVYLLWEIFFTEDGTGGFALMLVLWLICAAWLIVLGIWSAVAAIIDWRKRKKSKYT